MIRFQIDGPLRDAIMADVRAIAEKHHIAFSTVAKLATAESKAISRERRVA